MDNATKHWKILKELSTDLANRVRSFMVVGRKGNGVIVVAENGDGYWFGKVWFGCGKSRTAIKPTPLDVPGIVEMAQTNSHILLLNRRGQIYSMGRNDFGQLGLGTVDRKIHFSPKLISVPHKFTSVRCGDDYSLALTEDGKVWAWGLNVYGRVGAPRSTEFFSSPHQISELDSHRVVAVECGCYHSLALTDQGEVYGWGLSESRQLGDGSAAVSSTHTTTRISTPTRIPTPSPVKSIAAGQYHILLLTRTGEVYAYGENERYQVGIPTTTQSSVSLVAGLPPISQIASHHATNLSIAMSFDQRCFVWGELRNKISTSTPRELPLVYSTVESPLSSFSICRNTPHSVSIPETLPNRLFTRMSRMFDNPETSDVQFVVEHRTIHAHRIILRNSSEYFAIMFSERWLAPVDSANPIVRVTIPDHSYQVFHAFLCFLYTDCLEVHPDFLPELFELASQYLESDLQQLCLSRMRSTLTSATCCFYYHFTLRNPMPELAAFQQELVQFISANFHQISATDSYKSINDELCKKLNHSNVGQKKLSKTTSNNFIHN